MPTPSKIAQMPPELRQWLHQALVDRAFGDIVPLTEELNAKLKEAGVAIYIGKSAVGAESQKLKRAQESIRAATEAAKFLADGARDDADARSEAVMALVQTEMFDALLAVREANDSEDPMEKVGLMSLAAKNIATLSRARVNQSKFRREVEAAAKAAADAVAGIARAGGLSEEAIGTIRARVLGISKAV